MKSAVVVFPGINRERDMMRALELVTGEKPIPVWHADAQIPPVDLIVLPGGFSYGDYLRCGAMAAHSTVMKDVIRLAEKGTRVCLQRVSDADRDQAFAGGCIIKV